MDTAILGSGIVGLSTAYFLSQSSATEPRSIHLIEPSPELFRCASGLAGGFLAKDWFAPSVASLGALSFNLHKELAEQHDGGNLWGYSRSTAISYSRDSETAVGGSGEDWLHDGTSRAEAAGSKAPVQSEQGPLWLKRANDSSVEIISKDNSTGQIDPLRFCKFLLGQCLRRGVQLHQPARAIAVTKDQDGQLNGIRIGEDGKEIELPCSRLVITSGAWSPRVFNSLFPNADIRIPIAPLAGHALLIQNNSVQPNEEEFCHAVFATDTLGFSPELFSRIGQEIFLAGLNTTLIPLPELATDAKVQPEAVQKLKDCAAVMINKVGGKDFEVMRESLCFRPVTSSGRPIIARVPDEKLGGHIRTRGGADGGVFIAAGHGAWGISQAPGTGLCMAELIQDREPSANIKALALS